MIGKWDACLGLDTSCRPGVTLEGSLRRRLVVPALPRAKSSAEVSDVPSIGGRRVVAVASGAERHQVWRAMSSSLICLRN